MSEYAFDKLAFVRRSAFDTNGERKTVIIGESDDFRPLAAFGGPDREAPVFAPVKEASMKAFSSCSFPRACNSSARNMQDALQLTLLHPLLESGGGRSGTAGTCWVAPAIPLRYPKPTGFR